MLETKDLEEIDSDHLEKNSGQVSVTDNNDNEEGRSLQSATGSKKDSFLRRHELLVESGLAEVNLTILLQIKSILAIFFIILPI